MTIGKKPSIEEEQEFWVELFAVMVRYEERIKTARRGDRELTEATGWYYEI